MTATECQPSPPKLKLRWYQCSCGTYCSLPVVVAIVMGIWVSHETLPYTFFPGVKTTSSRPPVRDRREGMPDPPVPERDSIGLGAFFVGSEEAG